MTLGKMHTKRAVLYSYRLMHHVMNLDRLNQSEIDGNFDGYTRLKLLPKVRLFFPYSNGVTVRGVSFGSIDNDEFGVALKKSIKDDCFDVERFCEIFGARYKYEYGKSAGEILGLESSHKLNNYPIWSLVLPWEGYDIDHVLEKYPNDLYYNRGENYLDFLSNDRTHVIEQVYAYAGAKSQALQTKHLFDSIVEKGILKSPSMPKVIILRDGNKWRWMMGGQGNHRAYLVNQLGYKYLYAEVIQWVDVDNAESWANVKNGLYSKDEAMELFDRAMSGSGLIRGMV